MKSKSNVFSELVMIFNNAIKNGKFPNSLNCADVKTVFKKDSIIEK